MAKRVCIAATKPDLNKRENINKYADYSQIQVRSATLLFQAAKHISLKTITNSLNPKHLLER